MKQGWVGRLPGAVLSCGLAIACVLADPATSLSSERSVDGRVEGVSAAALVRLAAADTTGQGVGAPVVTRNGPGRTGKGTSALIENGSQAAPPLEAETATIEEPTGAETQAAVSGESFAADESVLLNFERGDIREVIHSLATALGLSYMIDPRVEGQVTIRTIGRISKDHLFPVFNRILRNNGIAAIKVGEVYHIVPVGEAKTRAILPPTAAGRAQLEATDSFIIEIIPVLHVAAEDMVGVLEAFVTPGGDIFAYPRGNLLIVTDLLSNVERLRELAVTLDTDMFRGMKTRIYKIEHGDLEVISEEIATLLGSYGHSVDGSTGLSLIPMPRLESLTAISYDPAVFEQIERWIDVLDIKPEEGAGRKIHVYRVENTKADDLAAILNELFGDGGGSSAGQRAGGGAFGQSRSAFGRAGTSTRRGGLTGATGQPLGGSRAGRTAAARQTSGNLQIMSAEQRSPNQTGTQGRAGRAAGQRGQAGLAARRGGGGAQAGGGAVGVVLPGGRDASGRSFGGIPGPAPIFKEEVRIVSDEVTNSLVFLAVKQDYDKILGVLKEIDVVPRQVVIEVVIAEVTLDKGLEFGVDHAVRTGKLTYANRNMSGALSGIDGGDGGAADSGTGSDLGDSLWRLANPGAGGLTALITDKENFGIVLKALASRSLVKILSAPHIIAADNREAHIQVGQSIPILTGTSTNTTNLNNVVNQIQYRDTGTILTILPQVNSAGLVNMQVSQEISAVGADSFGSTNSPSFLTRESETTVVVQDGDSILIGGIIDEQQGTTRSGVPFIMDIPVLGRLFRFEKATVTRTELLVLITPHVIRNRQEALAVTDEFKKIIRGFDRMIDQRRNRGVAPRFREQDRALERGWQ